MTIGRSVRIFLSAIAVLLATSASVAAQSNDEIFPQLIWNFSTPGARANAMGRAFVGMADDATATITNPAGLVSLTRPQVYFEFKSTNLEAERLAEFDSLTTKQPTTFSTRRQCLVVLQRLGAVQEPFRRRVHRASVPELPGEVHARSQADSEQPGAVRVLPGGRRKRRFQGDDATDSARRPRSATSSMWVSLFRPITSTPSRPPPAMASTSPRIRTLIAASTPIGRQSMARRRRLDSRGECCSSRPTRSRSA